MTRDFVSDFDVMLEKKKAERQGNRRRRKDIDIINDNDDLIADMVHKMKLAAEVQFDFCHILIFLSLLSDFLSFCL